MATLKTLHWLRRADASENQFPWSSITTITRTPLLLFWVTFFDIWDDGQMMQMQACISGAPRSRFPLFSNNKWQRQKACTNSHVTEEDRLRKLSGFHSLPLVKITKLTLRNGMACAWQCHGLLCLTLLTWKEEDARQIAKVLACWGRLNQKPSGKIPKSKHNVSGRRD